MKVVFSKHAKQKKFPMLAKPGLRLSEVGMVNVLKNGDNFLSCREGKVLLDELQIQQAR